MFASAGEKLVRLKRTSRPSRASGHAKRCLAPATAGPPSARNRIPSNRGRPVQGERPGAAENSHTPAPTPVDSAHPVRRSHRTTEIRPSRPPAHAAQHTGARMVAKFLLNYHGGKLADTPEGQATAMAAWTTWFGQLGSALIDAGNPSGRRRPSRLAVPCPTAPPAVHRLFDHPGQLDRSGRQGVADVPRPGDRRQRRDRPAPRDHVVPGFGDFLARCLVRRRRAARYRRLEARKRESASRLRSSWADASPSAGPVVRFRRGGAPGP